MRSFVDPWEHMLLSYALQHFVELCIIYHRDDPQLHQIAPHEREFCQGFGVVAFQQVISPLKSAAVQRPKSLAPFGG